MEGKRLFCEGQNKERTGGLNAKEINKRSESEEEIGRGIEEGWIGIRQSTACCQTPYDSKHQLIVWYIETVVRGIDHRAMEG